MSGYFTKLDSGITDSTVWREPDTTRLVWITLLSMADQNGYVGASVPGLADRARVSLDACLVALDCFRSPDKWSRSQEFDGRRIADVEGGWALLNHAKYRAMRDAEVRKEQVRAAVGRFRAKQADVINGNQCKPCKPVKAQADTEAEADTKKKKLGGENPKNGFRLPLDWMPSEDLKSWAIDQLLAAGKNHGVTLTGEIETFKDHWKAKTGRDATKMDWDATFRNWIRKAIKFRSGGVNERTERHSAIDRVAGNVRRSNQSAPAGFESGGRVIDHG